MDNYYTTVWLIRYHTSTYISHTISQCSKQASRFKLSASASVCTVQQYYNILLLKMAAFANVTPLEEQLLKEKINKVRNINIDDIMLR